MQLRFCATAEYPANKEKLHERLLKESTTFPLRNALHYFEDYFRQGGQRVHPILGDLADFIAEVDSRWDVNTSGINLIVRFLREKLGPDIEVAPERLTFP